MEGLPLDLTKSMRVALMSIHFSGGEALWVEGVSPGPHKINEGFPRELLNRFSVYMYIDTHASHRKEHTNLDFVGQYCLFVLPILGHRFSNIGKKASSQILVYRPILPIDQYWKILVAPRFESTHASS